MYNYTSSFTKSIEVYTISASDGRCLIGRPSAGHPTSPLGPIYDSSIQSTASYNLYEVNRCL